MRRQIFLIVIVASLMSPACSNDHTANKPAPLETGFVRQGETPSPKPPRKVVIGDVATTFHCDYSGGAAAIAGPLPVYPRATQRAGGRDPQGGYFLVLGSDDSWQTVVQWYRHAMPAGAEEIPKPSCQKRLPTWSQEARFSVGTRGKDYRVVLITGIPTVENARGILVGNNDPRTIILQNR